MGVTTGVRLTVCKIDNVLHEIPALIKVWTKYGLLAFMQLWLISMCTIIANIYDISVLQLTKSSAEYSWRKCLGADVLGNTASLRGMTATNYNT